MSPGVGTGFNVAVQRYRTVRSEYERQRDADEHLGHGLSVRGVGGAEVAGEIRPGDREVGARLQRRRR